MPDLSRELLTSLAAWSTNGHPVSSLYVDVDGRRYPRKGDYMARAESLCHQLQREAEGLPREAAASVGRDVRRMTDVLQGLERGETRGVAMFSCWAAGLWTEVVVPTPFPDLARVAAHPYVLRLEVLVESYESFCTLIVNRAKARIFLSTMGRIEEVSDVFDEVPGQHDQGGWSQARYQRHIEDHVAHHLKRVAEVLLRFWDERGFDHLILAGPDELLPMIEHDLHDYLRRRVAARINLTMTASPDEVQRRASAVEQDLEEGKERQMLERLHADAAAGRAALTGLPDVLEALNEGRVGTMIVPFGLERPGTLCTSCGRLALEGEACGTCGAPVEPVADVVETAVATALRHRVRVAPVSQVGGNPGPVGALLRY